MRRSRRQCPHSTWRSRSTISPQQGTSTDGALPVQINNGLYPPNLSRGSIYVSGCAVLRGGMTQQAVLTLRQAMRSMRRLLAVVARVLGCSEGRSADRWQDYSLFGHQVLPRPCKPPAKVVCTHDTLQAQAHGKHSCILRPGCSSRLRGTDAQRLHGLVLHTMRRFCHPTPPLSTEHLTDLWVNPHVYAPQYLSSSTAFPAAAAGVPPGGVLQRGVERQRGRRRPCAGEIIALSLPVSCPRQQLTDKHCHCRNKEIYGYASSGNLRVGVAGFQSPNRRASRACAEQTCPITLSMPSWRSHCDLDNRQVPHFGLALGVDDFHALAARVEQEGIRFIIQPHIRFEGVLSCQGLMLITAITEGLPVTPTPI